MELVNFLMDGGGARDAGPRRISSAKFPGGNGLLVQGTDANRGATMGPILVDLVVVAVVVGLSEGAGGSWFLVVESTLFLLQIFLIHKMALVDMRLESMVQVASNGIFWHNGWRNWCGLVTLNI